MTWQGRGVAHLVRQEAPRLDDVCQAPHLCRVQRREERHRLEKGRQTLQLLLRIALQYGLVVLSVNREKQRVALRDHAGPTGLVVDQRELSKGLSHMCE